MGVSQPTVSDFERGGQEGRDSQVSIIQRYARAIGIEPKEPELVEPPAGKAEGSEEEGTR